MSESGLKSNMYKDGVQSGTPSKEQSFCSALIILCVMTNISIKRKMRVGMQS